MEITKPVYELSQNAAVIRTYSLTTLHIGMLSSVAEKLGINQSEAVRRAIELLYQTNQDNGHEA